MKTPKIAVVLELTKDEAQTLLDIVGHCVLGCSENSRRKHTDAVYAALRAIGMNCANGADIDRSRGGIIYFKDKDGR